MYPNEKRLKARSLYVYSQLSLRNIAEIEDIQFETVRRWKWQAQKDGDCWDRARSAAVVSQDQRDNFIQKMVQAFVMLQMTVQEEILEDDGIPPETKAGLLSGLAEAFAKMMRAQEKAQPDINRLAVAMEVLHKLVDFVQRKYPQEREKLLEILEPFAAELNTLYT